MSEKQFEECSLEEATHVKVNDKVHLLENDKIALEHYHNECIGIRWLEEDAFIPIDMFSILGIKTLREVKLKPIEFIGYTKYFTNCISHIMYVPQGVPAGTKFKCVQILEED